MLPPKTDYSPELWERIQNLFEKMLDAADAAAILAAESDRAVAEAAARLYGNHQRAQAEQFLDEPITLIRHLDPGNAPSGTSADWDGRVVSHFRILRKLGEGGMGKVYLAEDLTLHRQVALKFLALKPHADPRAFLDRFRREARAAAALKHPNICTIHGVEECDGQPVIEMEFVEGETLAERIAKGAVPPEEALTIAMQIAGALAEAHRKGIVHRDLKPANIILTEFGVKVLDFGLAKITRERDLGEETPTLTSTAEGTVMGTPYYMSPEQARAEEADGRSDLFSLGVVLYEMATGERPFTGPSSPAVLAAVLKETPLAPSQRKPGLPAGLDAIAGKALEKDREARYQSAEEMIAACEQLRHGLELPRSSQAETVRPRPWRRIAAGAATVAALATGLGIWLTMAHKAHALGAADTIVLADFANRTGDAEFDGDTLKEALSAGLMQSPFLSIVPDKTVSDTLKLMSRPKDSPLGNDTARELCVRAGGRAYIAGSIARLGTQYRIELRAVECESTDVMALTEATVQSKERVIQALGDATRQLREKVGESLASVQHFSVPLDQVTTPSIDALKAYSMGRKVLQTDPVSAQALFQYAIRLDPKFAMAVLSLGLAQETLNETVRSGENYRQAYDLREGRSEWEKFAIESRYYLDGVGDLEQARRTYATWAKTYPREPIAITTLGDIDDRVGQHEAALEAYVQAARIQRGLGQILKTGYAHLALDQFDDARSAFEEPVANKQDTADVRMALYQLAFLRNDRPEMAKQVAWSAGKAAIVDQFLIAESQTAAFQGHVSAARQFSRQAVELAQQADEKEIASSYEALAALREALFGFRKEARERAAAALKLSDGKDMEYGVGLALALAGDTSGAESLAKDLDKRFPMDTIGKVIRVPAIRGQAAVNRKDSAAAVDILRPSASYELGIWATLTPNIYVAYVRGEAYMAGARYPEAAAEFQKILSHRGLVNNEPIGALARLNLGRAYAGQRDIAKAKENYQAFLTLWKEADPDVPILKQAQNEYQKLK